jgi:cardiolipin synthase
VLFDAFGVFKNRAYKDLTNNLNTIGADWYSMLPARFPGKNFNRPDLRNHRKIVVIDGDIGYTGSQNIIQRNYHRSDDLYYDELMVRVEGPVVMQLQAAFVTDWYSESNELLTRDEAADFDFTTVQTGDTLAQVIPSGPGYDNDNNLKIFTSLIHTADKKIVIVNPYFVPDDSLMIALTSAAQRGVEVIMVNSEIMDQRMVGHAQRSYYEELLKAGVQIFLYNKPILLHSKYLTIDDDIATVGSSNLDMRSFQLDLEVTLLIYDKAVVKELTHMTDTYLKKSKLLTLSAWQSRTKRTKLLDNIARLTASLQ